jgi:hypothetical protein
MVNHKIQSSSSSSSSGLQLYLSQVPKMLRMLTLKWATKSYIISFKLETDENILYEKAWKAICNYRVNLVVANLLHTRTNVCYLIYDNKLVVSNAENNNINDNNNHDDKVIKESQYQYQMITDNLSVDNRSVEIINKEHGIIELILVSKVIEKHINFYNQSIIEQNKYDDVMNKNYSDAVCYSMCTLNALNKIDLSLSLSSDEVVKTGDNMLSYFQQYIDIINAGGM